MQGPVATPFHLHASPCAADAGEAGLLMQLLSGLLAAGVPSSDIGIISPYKAQVGGFDQIGPSGCKAGQLGQLWQLLSAAGIKVSSAQQRDAVLVSQPGARHDTAVAAACCLQGKHGPCSVTLFCIPLR